MSERAAAEPAAPGSPGDGAQAHGPAASGANRLAALALSAGLAALVLGPVSFAFYRALAALPPGMRIAFTGVAMAILVLGALLVRRPLRQMGATRYWLAGATVVLGWLMFAGSDVQVKSADLAQVGYSDGRQEPNVPPSPMTVSGREIAGYGLHPAYEGAVVADSLVASFSAQPREVHVLFAKPLEALYQADGTPTDSDGISVQLRAFDAQGKLGYSDTFVIPQQQFMEGEWVEKTVRVASGIASISVSTGWGPPGGTPFGDFTMVGFQVPAWKAQVELLGRLMILCLGFFVVALFVVLGLNLPDGARLHRGHRTVAACGALVVLGLVVLAYGSQSLTSYVYFWDYRNYWEKTETLYGLVKDGAWRQAMAVFGAAYTSNYSMLPAVGPALLSQLTGSPGRINYALSITALYAAPAYLMVAYLAKRLLDGDAPVAQAPGRNRWLLASVPVVLGLPAYFGTVLYLMPDIGGVVLSVAALLSASSLVGAIKAPSGPSPPWQVSRPLLRAAISVGVLFGLMFVFRRWYVFFAAGIACALFVAVLVELALARGNRRVLAWRAVASALLVSFAALPLLCWFLFAWSRDFGQHDYSTLYASYRFTLGQDAQVFKQLFGVVVPVLCLAGVALVYRACGQKRLLFMLVAATVIASLMFLGIQSPGRHHYYLLMPLLGSMLAGVSLLLARRFGAWAAVALSLLIGVGGVLATRPLVEKSGVAVFAGYDDWKPRQQLFADGFADMSRWLAAPENQDRRFCLIASSVAINQGLFRELWQILPNVAKNAYDQRMIHMGQVDSVDGPPLPSVKQCEIFLVGVPFQSHLMPDQQTTLSIMQRDLVEGTGIGAAVDRQPTVFTLGDGIEVLAFRTQRGLSDQEYDDLVKRFQDNKAALAQ